MKRLWLALALCLAASPAAAWLPHGTAGAASPSCPYADQASTDGCSAAPAGLEQVSNFFTVGAPLSGQSYESSAFTASIASGVMTVSGASGTPLNVATTHATILGAGIPAGVYVSSFGTGTGGNGTYNLANASGVSFSGSANALYRPWWNVAGVDYGVGITTSIAAHLDPATNAPAWCVYHSSGSIEGGGPYLACTSTGSSSTLTNLNLSGNALTGFGHACVNIEIEGGTGAMIFDNVYFENDSACPITNNSTATTYLIAMRNPGTPITVNATLQNSTFIGHGDNVCCNQPGAGGGSGANLSGGAVNIWLVNTTATNSEQNNYFNSWPGGAWFADSTSAQDLVNEHNFYGPSTQRVAMGHAEYGGVSGPINSELFSYNLFFDNGRRNNNYAGQLSAEQIPSAAVTSFQADHNTFVTNFVPGATQPGYTVTPSVVGSTLSFTSLSSGGQILSYQGIVGTSDIGFYQCTGSGVSATCSYDCGAETLAFPETQWCATASSSGGLYNVNSGLGSPVSIGSVSVISLSGGNNFVLLHGIYANTVQVLDNYVDSTGSGSSPSLFGVNAWSRGGEQCNGTPGSNFSGNIDMLTGNSLDSGGFVESPGTGC